MAQQLVATEAICLSKPKILTNWPFTGEMLVSALDHLESITVASV